MQSNTKQWSLISLVLALALVSVLYRVIGSYGYGHSSLMFVGIPTILALLLILSKPSRSTASQVFRGVTLFLLMVGILAWEGLICILMAAPIFYLSAFIVLWVLKRVRNRSVLRCVAVAPLLILALEGTNQYVSFNRDMSVEVIRTHNMSGEEFLEKISQAPVFESALPLFFRIGFPVPTHASAVGDYTRDKVVNYVVHFTGPEKLKNRLTVRGRRIAPNKIVFEFIDDSTKVGHWMTWQHASLTWVPQGEQISVTYKVDFQRNLDPYWYFAPIQFYAVNQAADYLLNTWSDGSD